MRPIRDLVAVALALGVAATASAHHPPKMDHCANFSFAGRIERIDWRSPHVEILIRADEGMTRRVSWLAVNQLTLAGIDRNTLRVGDEVEVTAGIFVDDTAARPLWLSYIHRASDGWGWSQKPQGC